MLKGNEEIRLSAGNCPIRNDEYVNNKPGQEGSFSFAQIALALSRDYFSIFIVDTQTDQFQEYEIDDGGSMLRVKQTGQDFFELSRKNAEKTVYAEDLPRFLTAFTKTNILSVLRTNKTFTVTYRILINYEPAFVTMKISRLTEAESTRIVIGINNIQAGVDQRRRNLPFTSISKALARNYTSIYYLDSLNDDYIEFRSQPHKEGLDVQSSGSNFFEYFPASLKNRIHPDDEARFYREFTRDNFYEQLGTGHTFKLTYRQLQNDRWNYVLLKASGIENEEDNHIIIGISDIDAQVRREEQQIEALRLASIDSLTRLRTKNVYQQEEKNIDFAIHSGTADPFAIVYCDLNNLKQINDTYGHAEGDKFIQQAARVICHVYKHSPVFRIGGDEFIAILRGEDYNNRDHLLRMITSLNYAQPVGRQIVIATGMSEYRPDSDTSLSDVTNRADQAMYENKKKLKQDLSNPEFEMRDEGSFQSDSDTPHKE